jgi:hypothetical protein
VDLDRFGVAVVKQGQHFTSQVLTGGNPAIQTLTSNHRELALDHVQPTSSLGGVVELKALGKGECLLGTQMLVKRTGVMSVEIVQHQSNLGCLPVGSRKLLTKQGEFALGSSRVYLPNSSSRERLDRCQQHTRTQFLVFIVLLRNLAFAHWSGQQGITNQETRSLIEAYNWIARIIGLGIQPQDVFKLCQKGRIDFANAPGLFQMRLEFVFLSTSRTKV